MKQPFSLLATGLVALSLVACGGDDPKQADSKADATKSDAAAVPAASADAPSAARPFKVKSGILDMTIDMMGEQKQTLYFDDFGAKQAMITEIEMMGQKSQSITINADGFSITYDPAKKEGTKMKMPVGATSSAIPTLDKLTDEMKAEYKLKELDAQTIAGKEAQGYEMEAMGMPMKFWLWEGIPMRTEVKMGEGAIVTEVKNLQLDVEVPADRFVVPADIKLTER